MHDIATVISEYKKEKRQVNEKSFEFKKREYRDGIKRKETRLGWCGTLCMHGA